jgi:hypothetical protein
MSTSNLDELWRKMAAAAVLLPIEVGRISKTWEYGTAFMVSPLLAVTADHNKPAAVRMGRTREVQAVFINPITRQSYHLTFEWLPLDESLCELHDVGVLRLTNRPGSCPLDHLRPGLWPADLATRHVAPFLSARLLAIYGFRINDKGDGQEECRIRCPLNAETPLVLSDSKDLTTGKTRGITERLQCQPDEPRKLYGASGAPIVDVETGLVIGVENEYADPKKLVINEIAAIYNVPVRGSPLALIQAIWPEFARETNAVWLLRGTTEGPRNDIRTKIRQRLTALDGKTLAQDGAETPLLEFLSRSLIPDERPKSAELTEQLVEALATENDLAIDTLQSIYRQFAERVADLALQVKALVDLVIPLQIPKDLRDRIGRSRSLGEPLVPHAAGGIISAEAVAASLAGKEMDVEPGKDNEPRPRLLKDDHTYAKEALGKPEGQFESFVAALYKRTWAWKKLPGLEAMLSELQGYYAQFERNRKRPPYLVMRLPREEIDREPWLRVLRQFQQELEKPRGPTGVAAHVLFLEISDDPQARSYDGMLSVIWETVYLDSMRKRDR